MAHQVFLSHATEDRETAFRLCGILEAADITCWMAPRDVKTGTDQAAATVEAIRHSDLVVLIFSASANASPYVLREIERAVAYERRVLSIHVDDSVPSASMEYYLNLWQWLEVRGGVEKKWKEIINAVRGQLAQAQGPPESVDGGTVVASETTGQPVSGAPERAGNAFRWSRRTRWWIAVATVLLVAVVTVAGTWAAGTWGGTSVSDQGTWTELNPFGTLPTARASAEMVCNPATNRLIMFGGWIVTGFLLSDTWAYDPAANEWTELSTAGTTPSAREAHSMEYDPSTQRVIMFGGGYNETWAFNPKTNTWADLRPSGTLPSPRVEQSMVYVSSKGLMIMFGGWDETQTNLNDTWAYDPTANTWTNLDPTGTLPSPRGQHSMVYDPVSDRVIMFGGFSNGDVNDTWAYDPTANTWTNLDPSGRLPAAREQQSMVYDPSSSQLIMFGGRSGNNRNTDFNDTWAYDPAANTWTKISPSGTVPIARHGQSMVYDPSFGRVVVFGGRFGGIDKSSGCLGDTWAYTP